MGLRTKANLSLLTSAFILGSFSIYTRYMAYSFSDPTQLLIRSIFVFLCFLTLIYFKKIEIKLSRIQLLISLNLGLVFGIEVLLLITSFNSSTFFQTISTFYIGFLLSGTIMSIVLKEKISQYQIIGGLITFCALILLFNTNSLILKPAILGLISGLLETFSGLLRKKAKDIESNTVLLFQYVGMMIVSGFAVSFSRSIPYTKFSLIAFIALLLFIISHFTMSKLMLFGFQNTSVLSAAIILVIEIPLTLIFGKIFFSEPITTRSLIIIALIIGGSVLSQIPEKTKTKQRNVST